MCQRLTWDSEFFGVEVARTALTRLSNVDLAALFSWCDAHGTDCLYFLADASHPETVRLAQQSGFTMVDFRVALEHSMTTEFQPAAAVRPAAPQDLPELQRIARVSHRTSRFYSDGRFPAAQCDLLFERWIEKSCQAWADTVFVATIDERPAGYVTCHIKNTRGEIGLFAVAPEARQRGFGRALLDTSLKWFKDSGCGSVQVVTQGASISAQRLYQSVGFRTCSVGLWFHRWFYPHACGAQKEVYAAKAPF
jgi:dTDP-4-amino-4,6-dideoxy-D-galactose acyltransferase